jgi:putative spermidine/putrescine transport system permease protein
MKISLNRVVTVGSVLILAILIFILPLVAASEFSFRGAGGKGHSFINYVWLIHQDGFVAHLLTSLQLALLSGMLNLALMVPTAVLLHLKLAKWRSLVEFICILPLIIPVVSLAIGAQVAMPKFVQNSQYELVFFFVIIALPFTYRTLDTSLSSIDLKILVEASRSLGASWPATIIRVIIPSIKGGITGALFLSFALAIGEFTITSLLHWDTFPTWTVVAAQQNILGAIALSVFSFVGAVLLMVMIAMFSNRRKDKSKSQLQEVAS